MPFREGVSALHAFSWIAAFGGVTIALTASVGSCTDNFPDRAVPDPRHVRCGKKTCDTPGEFCCNEAAVSNDEPRCVKEGEPCSSPRIACDEIGDCSSDSTCCTTTSAVRADGGTLSIEGTTCESIDTATCLGRNTSAPTSIQVCKVDAECTNGEDCIVQRCQGRTLATCGKNPRCE